MNTISRYKCSDSVDLTPNNSKNKSTSHFYLPIWRISYPFLQPPEVNFPACSGTVPSSSVSVLASSSTEGPGNGFCVRDTLHFCSLLSSKLTLWSVLNKRENSFFPMGLKLCPQGLNLSNHLTFLLEGPFTFCHNTIALLHLNYSHSLC